MKIHDWFFYKRLVIAERLNKNPAYCWSKLVDWANLYIHDGFWSWLWPFHFDNNIKDKSCKPDGTNYWAYCGKCKRVKCEERTGNLGAS